MSQKKLGLVMHIDVEVVESGLALVAGTRDFVVRDDRGVEWGRHSDITEAQKQAALRYAAHVRSAGQ